MFDRAARFKRIARKARAIPGQFGLRTHRVFLRVQPNVGTEFGDNLITQETEFVEGDNQPPKVRFLNDEQLQLGNLPQGSVEIGPVTPGTASAGILDERLRGDDLGNLDTLTLRIVGPSGDAIYTIKKRPMDRALHRMITASPLAQSSDG